MYPFKKYRLKFHHMAGVVHLVHWLYLQCLDLSAFWELIVS